MQTIPLARARHAKNFAAVLDSKGIPIDRYLERSLLPVNMLEEVSGDDVLCALKTLEFAEYAATDAGLLDLGYWAGLMPLKRYGVFGANVTRSPTLFAALRTYCSTVRTECSEANYYVKQSGSTIWFCHCLGEGGPGLPQHELYALMIMVQVIRLALGQQWKPASIRLQQPDERILAGNEFMVPINIEFGAQETGIEISPRDLAKQVVHARNGDLLSQTHNEDSGLTPFPHDPLTTLQTLIETQLLRAAPPSIELASEMTGISTRTLQRYLRHRGTSFSDLKDQARFIVARNLLDNDTMSIADIAHEIGYSNTANFSRAFRRLTGMSPRQYRRHLLNH